MRSWLLLLAGPIIWAAHFAAIYAIASISTEAFGMTTSLARFLIFAAGLVALIATGLVLLKALRPPHTEPFDTFLRTVSLAGALIAGIAIIWQTLPALGLG